ncbi:sensor histidine kinase [Ruminococcus gauvreauii]|uniref:histidine kinase n=1 Tax=Ruminococcus gauvreauii TaxID=438033 RepID=A0ABY5VKK3_9FIRM|nr:histidine kinase [Ruminococcus gauvreauii]UWP61135.1 histidine kinase [Ruminococcus gauvreauii]
MKSSRTRFPIKYLFMLPYLLLLAVGIYYHNGILLSGIFIVCVSGFCIYRQLFCKVVTKIDAIKEHYTLSVPEQIDKDYIKYLCFILDMVDHTLDTEYSNQLMRKQAEFDSMKSQINPHFLYNTLDSIRGYALQEKAPIAADMIEILSRIFRYTISQKNDIIMIREELAMAGDYLAIQKYRLNNQVVLNVTIQNNEEQLLDCRVPKLIIQPFIENAVKHGMKDNVQDFHIDIDVSTVGDRMIISVTDDGCGMTTEQLALLNDKLYSNEYGKSGSSVKSQKGSGIAIVNVNARIKLLYGETYGVTAYSTQGIGSCFEITMPYDRENQICKVRF